MLDRCPGAANLRTPTLSIQDMSAVRGCSNEIRVVCSKCGFVIYNDLLSCVQWCKYVRECMGMETYRRHSAEESERSTRGGIDPPRTRS